MNDVLSALPFSVLLIFATGPLFFLILETSISKGIKPAFLIDLGAVFADAVFVLVAFLGTKSLLADIKDNPNLYILGGVLLMVYAIISAITTIRKKEEIIENDPIEPKGFLLFSYFIKGFFLNIINVGTFLFWLGLLVSIAPTLELESGRIIVFFSTVMLGYLILGFVKIVLAKQLSKTLTPPVIYKIRLSVCVLLAIFGIYFIYQGLYAPEPDVLLPSINQWK
ncbi:MAG: LysE family transporter [Flavobacteriaceae bacterium]|nr:LysE family transporter [Flavobacteriaceae bacterium]